MLLNTATEELGHIEMLATAVALNLEGAPRSMQEEASANMVAGSVLNGMDFRHILSTGMGALPSDAKRPAAARISRRESGPTTGMAAARISGTKPGRLGRQ